MPYPFNVQINRSVAKAVISCVIRKAIFVISEKTFPLKLKGKVSVRSVHLCVTVCHRGTVGTDLGGNEPALEGQSRGTGRKWGLGTHDKLSCYIALLWFGTNCMHYRWVTGSLMMWVWLHLREAGNTTKPQKRVGVSSSPFEPKYNGQPSPLLINHNVALSLHFWTNEFVNCVIYYSKSFSIYVGHNLDVTAWS